MSNEQLRIQLQEKYNINLDLATEVGNKTYYDLREYFTNEIKDDNLLIPTDWVTMCCHRTDIKAMKDEFSKQLKEFTEYEHNGECEDLDYERIFGERCQYSDNNLEHNEIQESTEQEPPPAYNKK